MNSSKGISVEDGNGGGWRTFRGEPVGEPFRQFLGQHQRDYMQSLNREYGLDFGDGSQQ